MVKDPLVPNFHADVLHAGIAARICISFQKETLIFIKPLQEFNRLMGEFLES
jgi:hypothetical protein